MHHFYFTIIIIKFSTAFTNLFPKMVQVLKSWKDLGRLWETNVSHSGIGSNSITPFNRIQRLEITVNQQLHVQIWSLGSSFTFVTVAIKWEISYPNWIKEVLTLNVWFSCTVKGTAKWIWDRSIFSIIKSHHLTSYCFWIYEDLHRPLYFHFMESLHNTANLNCFAIMEVIWKAKHCWLL